MSGPNIVIETDQVTTWDADGYTKIQMGSDKWGSVAPKSLITMFQEKCKEGGSNLTAFKVKRDGKWLSWSYTDYYRDAKCAARAFIKLGLEERHSVCIQGFNSPEWFLSCVGAVHAGGIVSGLFMRGSSVI